MLSLRNPFSKSTPAPEPAEASMAAVNELNNAVKRWQLEQGRTRKRVEELTGQLEVARPALAQRRQMLGEKMVDELDVTTDTAEMNRAADHVRALEVAISVAIQKDEAAQAELQQAERDLADAAREDAIETAMELGVQLGMLHNQVKRERLKLASALKVLVRTGGCTQLSANEIMDQHDFYAKIALRSPAADEADSGSFRKYRSLYHCIGYLCGRADP